MLNRTSTRIAGIASERIYQGTRRSAFIFSGSALVLLGAHASLAATATWDTSDTTGFQAGSGTWSTSAANWSDGVGGVSGSAADRAVWTSSASSGNDAIFADSANSGGPFAVSVSGSFSASGISFTASGYTLSASSASIITLGGNAVSVASGQSATIGNNVTLTRAAGVTVSGTGTLNVGSGAVLEATSTSTYNLTTSATTVNVNGGTIRHTGTGAGGTIIVGGGGTLTLASGTVTTSFATSRGLSIGDGAGGAGTVNLNGGTLQAGSVFKTAGGGTATINFDGGTLQAGSANNASTFMTGLSAVNIKDGGARIDTNGFNITIGQALLHGGSLGTDGLTKLGGGTLTLTGANSYGDVTDIQNGDLVLSGSAVGELSGGLKVASGSTFTPGATYTIGTGKTLTGSGTVTNSVNASGSKLNPGDTAGVLNIQGGLTLDSLSALNFSLNASSSITDDEIKLSGGGALVLDGTLNITNAGSFGAGVYTLISGATRITDQGLLIGPAPTGYSYAISNNGSGVLLTVSAPEPSALAAVGFAIAGLGLRRRRN